MTCGTPVVSTDCPSGPGEIITDCVDGLLVPPADPAGLARALERLLLDRALAKRMSEAGRIRAQAFSAEVIVRRYEAILADVTGAAGALGPFESG
jgi:glycosyltransferase involved in cell wall biosynthesis